MAARYRAARHQGYFGEREHTLMVRSCLEEDRRREGDDKAHSKIPSVRQLGKHLLKVLTATGAHGGEWSSRASQQMRAHYSDLCAVAAGLCRHLDLLVALCAALWEHQPKGGAGSRSSTVDDTLEEAVLAVRKVVDLLDRSEREPLLRQLGTLIPAPPPPP